MEIETASPCGRRGLQARVSAQLDRRLETDTTAPVVIAFSGGGDSLALLLAAKSWADEAGRRLLAVTVDHRLHAAGAAWARWCRLRAARLGVQHTTVAWTAQKPATGIAAAARAARHGLLAEVAREAGAAVLLMGHTADDRLEARAMRAEGSNVSEPRAWATSPVWPQGQGVFILRPLLELRRAEIRFWLETCREPWLEDPANADPASARSRARVALGGGGTPRPERPWPDAAALLSQVRTGPQSEISIPLESLVEADTNAARAFTGAALLCVAGGAKPPRGPRLERLLARLLRRECFIATLAGARVGSDARVVTIAQESGEVRRRSRRRAVVADPWADRLVLPRLIAALGGVQDEAAIGRVAKYGGPP